ncbi:hypothetical protein HAZT_HAZT004801, partial [Hyalella azteca]
SQELLAPNTIPDGVAEGGGGPAKKPRRGIKFEGVTVYYFPRSQGFSAATTTTSTTTTPTSAATAPSSAATTPTSTTNSTAATTTNGSSDDDTEEEELSDLETDPDMSYLRPLAIRQRRSLLRDSGVRAIEGLEKEECRDIRASREQCGCQCKLYCFPDTCQCILAGIKCQVLTGTTSRAALHGGAGGLDVMCGAVWCCMVLYPVDRHNFPCGCSVRGCGNPHGRIEFNPIRVRTHFLHTLMRLEIEKRQAEQRAALAQQQQSRWLSCLGGAAAASAADDGAADGGAPDGGAPDGSAADGSAAAITNDMRKIADGRLKLNQLQAPVVGAVWEASLTITKPPPQTSPDRWEDVVCNLLTGVVILELNVETRIMLN